MLRLRPNDDEKKPPKYGAPEPEPKTYFTTRRQIPSADVEALAKRREHIQKKLIIVDIVVWSAAVIGLFVYGMQNLDHLSHLLRQFGIMVD